MRRWTMLLALAGLVAAPAGAEAQSRDGWWDWALGRMAAGQLVETDRGAYRVPGSGIDRDGEWNRTRTGQDPRADRRDDRERRDGGILDRIPDRDRRDRDRPGDRRDRRDRDDDDDRDDDWDDDDDDRYEDRAERRRGDRDRKGNGPPFCRNGEGHPVHGWEWCERKGWGDRRGVLDDVRWDRRSWEDIVLRAPRDRRYGAMDAGDLRSVLGDVVLGRLLRSGDDRGQLTGRWLRAAGGANVLQLRAGGVPLAELSDLDGDRRVDVALVARR